MLHAVDAPMPPEGPNNWSNETKEKHADTIRKMNEHENELLNMRFSWFTTLQGLLFASLGFVWKDSPLFVMIIISIMGITVALSFLSAIKLTRAAYNNLSQWWDKHLSDYDGPPLKALQLNSKMTFIRFFRPWRIMPWIFISAWAILLIYRIAA
ncbi:RipA family octameric membrane protein [Chitinophaga niabensis]|uniref:Uncharacterized protein n=1 Tax=Chitinophaga niabensis TaxID=536979 RepID=A0A1N6JTX0_9BACT|nr:hypothetical protein [Chitinophaga niabensis]SIO47785.1 hypothetical protein SAMN04488055_4425 [Chitinophaga niabensis]